MIAKVLCVAVAVFCVASASQERITGGSPGSFAQHSHVASILYHSPGSNVYTPRCAGAILSSHHLLTTAYCFNNAQVANFVVRAGSASTLSGGLTSRIRGLLKHPGYVASPRENDIALVFIHTPFPTGGLIRELYLPPQNQHIPVGTVGDVAGWGFDKDASEGGVQQHSLQTVSLGKVSLESCAAAYANVNDVKINDSVFCFSGANSGMCSGDSGAPMSAPMFSSRALIGLASFHVGCGSDAFPDVFTRVDRYTNWIMENAVIPTPPGQ